MTDYCTDVSCIDYRRSTSRRVALKTAVGVVGLSATAIYGSAFVDTAYAATGHASRVLVVLSMRGAADGLSLMIPHGDPVYAQARPTIAVPKSTLLAPDSYFGLHPSMAPLMPLWSAGQLAAIHATGQIVTTRSHFSAIEEVEDADPGSSARIGWLNRLISLRSEGVSPTTGLQLGGSVLDTELAGPAEALAAGSLGGLKLTGPSSPATAKTAWATGLSRLWASSPSSLGLGGREAIDVAGAFAPVIAAPASAVTYPAGDLGTALSSVAKTLKADVGAEVVTVDYGSWDHHTALGTVSAGKFKSMVDPFAGALAAFFQDLGPLASSVTVVTLSEFGRRVKENASQGLDHGHGNVMFVLGAGVKGGYYGRWPGLQNTQDADLAVTTDYRDVLSEIVKTLYPERSLASVFPSFTPTAVGFMQGTSGNTYTTPPPSTTNDGDGSTGTDNGTKTTNPPVTPPPAKTAVPATFFTALGAVKKNVEVGDRVTAPQPTLSAQGKQHGVKVSYRWEMVSGGKKHKLGDGRHLKLHSKEAGHRLQVRVTYSSQGYADRTKTFKYGRIHR